MAATIARAQLPPAELKGGEDLDAPTPDQEELPQFVLPVEGGLALVMIPEESLPWYVSACIANNVDSLRRSWGLPTRRDVLRRNRKAAAQSARYQQLEEKARTALIKSEQHAYAVLVQARQRDVVVVEWRIRKSKREAELEAARQQRTKERDAARKKREKEKKKRQQQREARRAERQRQRAKRKKKGEDDDEEDEPESADDEPEEVEEPESEEEIEEVDEDAEEEPTFDDDEPVEDLEQEEEEEHEEDVFLKKLLHRRVKRVQRTEDEEGEGEGEAEPEEEEQEQPPQRAEEEPEEVDEDAANALRRIGIDVNFRMALCTDPEYNATVSSTGDSVDVTFVLRSASDVATERAARAKARQERKDAREAAQAEGGGEEEEPADDAESEGEQDDGDPPPEIDLLTLCVGQRAVECTALLLHKGATTGIAEEYLETVSADGDTTIVKDFIAACAQCAVVYAHPISLDFSWLFESVLASQPLENAEQLLDVVLLAEMRPKVPIQPQAIASANGVLLLCRLMLKLLTQDPFSITLQKRVFAEGEEEPEPEPVEGEEEPENPDWYKWPYPRVEGEEGEGETEPIEEEEPEEVEEEQQEEEQPEQEEQNNWDEGENDEGASPPQPKPKVKKVSEAALARQRERERIRALKKLNPPRDTTFAAPAFVHALLRWDLSRVSQIAYHGEQPPQPPIEYPPPTLPKSLAGQEAVTGVALETQASQDVPCCVVRHTQQPPPADELSTFWSDCALVFCALLGREEEFSLLLQRKAELARRFGQPPATWEVLYKNANELSDGMMDKLIAAHRGVFRFGGGVVLSEFISSQFHKLSEERRHLIIHKFYPDILREAEAVQKCCAEGGQIVAAAEHARDLYAEAVAMITNPVADPKPKEEDTALQIPGLTEEPETGIETPQQRREKLQGWVSEHKLELYTPFYLLKAVDADNLAVVELFLDMGCPPMVAEEEYALGTPVQQYAVVKKKIPLILLLIRRGGSLLEHWGDGGTNALDYVRQNFPPADQQIVIGEWTHHDAQRCATPQHGFGVRRPLVSNRDAPEAA